MDRFGIVDKKEEAAKRAEEEVGSMASYILISFYFLVYVCVCAFDVVFLPRW